MKRNIFIAGIALFLSSCTTYYYSTLSSDDEAGAKDEFGDFVTENDSLRITYNFYGENAPVNITIYNKMDEPLYIDWQRSALIVDGYTTSYYDGRASFGGETGRNSSSTGYFSGQISLPDGVAFIPPKSKIQKTPLMLVDFPYNKIPDKKFRKQNFARNDNTVAPIKTLEFSETSSPLYFRSYLTLYTGNATKQGLDSGSPLVFEQSFYLSRLFKAESVSPADFFEYNSKQGNFFYTRDVKGAAAGAVAGSIAVVVVSSVIETAIERQY